MRKKLCYNFKEFFMVRFGKWEIYHREVLDAGKLATLFIKIFGCSSYTAYNFFIQMKKMLPSQKFHNILDAGCGKGDFSFYFAEKYKNCHIDGWDKSVNDLHDNINTCNRIKEISGLENCNFEKKDLIELQAKSYYDLIICIHVLEHIKDNKKIIENFYNALKPEGYLHIQMPSNINHRFNLLDKYTDFSDWEEKEHIGHTYSLKELSTILKDMGFKIIKLRTDGNFLAKYLFEIAETLRRRKNYILFALYILISKFLSRILSNFDNGRGNLIILAQKNRTIQ